jgi:hypothetical protein
MLGPSSNPEVVVLSEWERRTLVEIERHLCEDDRLDRALSSALGRRLELRRRFCFVLLVASPVLAIALAILGAAAGSLDAVLLGVLASCLLYFNPPPHPLSGR